MIRGVIGQSDIICKEINLKEDELEEITALVNSGEVIILAYNMDEMKSIARELGFIVQEEKNE